MGIRWQGSIKQWLGYCVNITIFLETSEDGLAWTVYKALSYTHDNSNMATIVIASQYDVINGNYRYARVRLSSSDNCLTSSTWLYVDGIVSY